MVVVYVAHLDLNKLLNHIFSFLKALRKEILHDVENSTLQLGKPLDFPYVDEMQHSSKLFMDKMRTFKRRQEESAYLLLYQILEGNLSNK